MTMATLSSWNSIKKAHHVDFAASRTWQISHSFDVIIATVRKGDEKTDNTMTKGKGTKRQTKQWPKEKVRKDKQNNDQRKRYEKTNNTMTKGKCTKRQTIQWPKEKVQKDRQYNDQRKRYEQTNYGSQNTTKKTKERH
jgi:hypothetical protein